MESAWVVIVAGTGVVATRVLSGGNNQTVSLGTYMSFPSYPRFVLTAGGIDESPKPVGWGLPLESIRTLARVLESAERKKAENIECLHVQANRLRLVHHLHYFPNPSTPIMVQTRRGGERVAVLAFDGYCTRRSQARSYHRPFLLAVPDDSYRRIFSLAANSILASLTTGSSLEHRIPTPWIMVTCPPPLAPFGTRPRNY